MVKKILSRSEFADLAKVSAAAVTKAAKGELKPAIVGRRIDAAHPAAVKYLANRDGAPPPKRENEPDPLYGEAAAWCYETQRYSVTGLRQQFKIGDKRARAILQQLKDDGLVEITKTPPAKQSTQPKQATRDEAKKQEKERVQQQARDALKEGVHHKNEPDEPPDPVPEDLRAFSNYTLREILERFGTSTYFGDWLRHIKTMEEIQDKQIKNRRARGELVERDYIAGNIFSLLDVAFKRLVSDVPKTTASEILAIVENGGEHVLPQIENAIREANGVAIRATKESILRRLENAG